MLSFIKIVPILSSSLYLLSLAARLKCPRYRCIKLLALAASI